MADYPEFLPAEVIPLDVVRRWLKSCGLHVRIYRGCRIANPERVAIGDYSQVDEGVYIFSGEGILIGRYVHLAFASSISGGGKCEIQDCASIAAGVRIITGTDIADGSGLTNPTVPPQMRSVSRDEVIIGAHAVIYTNAIVLPGVRVGTGAVVAAGAVVHHDLKPWGIYAGNPLVQVGVRPQDRILSWSEQINVNGK